MARAMRVDVTPFFLNGCVGIDARSEGETGITSFRAEEIPSETGPLSALFVMVVSYVSGVIPPHDAEEYAGLISIFTCPVTNLTNKLDLLD